MASEIPSKLKKNIFGKTRVVYDCPTCGLELDNTLDEAGNNDTCPGCDASFVVPGVVKRKELERQKTEKAEKKQQQKLQQIKDVEQARKEQISQQQVSQQIELARKEQIEIQRLAEQQKKVKAADEQKREKQCPFCMTSIPISATKCQFCAEFVDGRPTLQQIIIQSNPFQEYTGPDADARSHYLRGLGAAQTHEDFESAVQQFTEAIRIDPDYAEAYVARGCARLHNFNEFSLAIDDHTRAINLQPEHPFAYFHRADTYLEEGQDYLGALNDCNKAISLSPGFAHAFWLRSQVLTKLEEHERAKFDLERAEQLGFVGDGRWYPWQQVAVVPGGNERTQIEQVRVDGDQHRDGNAALSEFMPNFDPDDWDEELMEAFRSIVDAVNRLREGLPFRETGTSCPFSVYLDTEIFDPEIVEVVAQIGHSIEQLRAATEDGKPLPSADFAFRLDESIYHDGLVFFVRRIQMVLNGLRKGQSRPAIDSQLMLFDLSETQMQDDTSPSKSAEVPSRKDESVWQSLVEAAQDSGQYAKAVEVAEQAVREYPRSVWLWQELGAGLTDLGRFDEAENALNTAYGLNPNDACLWRYLAALHRKRKDLEGEIESLETLNRLNAADDLDLFRLGIVYHKHRDLAKAIRCYRQSAAVKCVFLLQGDFETRWFNLALAYSDPEVSQDADAADACRCALSATPDYAAARELLEKTKRKLAPLATQAKDGADGLVEPDEFFDFYISPFEMLQIEDVTFAAGPDAKAIKRAKDRLNAELQLNDGKVSWLDDYSLDKARALAVVDELDDEAKWPYHVEIFRNKPLLNFLTRSDIQHFLYSDDYFPRNTEERLHQEPEFRKFLSEPFARQYNRVLTRAIEQQRLAVCEVLFDGRRWVEPEDTDLCFEGASKRVGDIVEAMRSKARDGCSRKVGLREMQDFLRERSLPELFNLLPVHFASYQGDIVAELRSLAISCFNEHDDSILSRDILNLCKRFTSRDVAFNEQLQEDFKTIEAMISAERVSKATQQVSSTQTKIWFYLSNGKEYGPFDHDGITELARTGIIAPATLVRYSNGRSYCEAHSWGFLATAFDDANATKPRRPATAVVPKPETNVQPETLANSSDAVESFLWLWGRVTEIVSVLFFVGFLVLIAGALFNSCSTKTSPSSLPHTPSVSSTDPVRGPTVPPPKLLPAVPLPANGTVRRYDFSEGIAPLTIATRTGGGHYFVKLRTVGTGELIAEVFVREGQRASIEVPLGTYELTYATGRTWYGPKAGALFGAETGYAKADDTFTFRIDGNQILGYAVELYLQTQGNLETKPMSASKF